MDNDDTPVGRILTRREVLMLLGGSGAAFLAGCAQNAVPVLARQPAPRSRPAAKLPDCIVRPEMIEGPFFVDEKLNRSDIRTDPKTKVAVPGVPLQITFRVSQIGDSCAALPGALVDLWHCDALGRYSDIAQIGTGGTRFLRGSQVTTNQGIARFTTIYPGWYPGRSVHLHFKIRTKLKGRTHEFTSQLFFDEALTDNIHARRPYTENGPRDTRNETDQFYQYRGDGQQLMLALKPAGGGYKTTFDIGLDLT